jgi:hypothetical protein
MNKRIIIFNSVIFVFILVVPDKTLDAMFGQKKWSQFGNGNVAVKVLKTELFKYSGNTCRIKFEAKNNTNSSFQMLALSFKVVGKDRSIAPMSVVFEELRMNDSQIKDVILTNNIECSLIDHLEFDQVSICSVRDGMLPINVGKCNDALMFEGNGAIEIRNK